jgi:PAS domain S-box-containing protein
MDHLQHNPQPGSRPQNARQLESFRAALSTATSFAHALADSLPGIVYLFDSEARLLWWNQALERLTGYDFEELANSPISKLVPARDLRLVQERFQEIMKVGIGSVQTSLVLRTGAEVPHLFTGRRMEFSGAPCLIGMGLEVSEQVRAERRRIVRLAVPQLLAGAEDLAAVATPVLRTLGECLAWDVGVIWAVDAMAGVLRCIETWEAPSITDHSFAQATRRSTFQRGVGLPGRVWKNSQPDWIAEIAEDENFPRASIAAESGLHSAFACPLRAGGEVLGVLEFFSPTIRSPDADLLEMMNTLGNQIGQFMRQHSAQSELRRGEARTRAILDVALDCIIAIDHEEQILEFNPAAEQTFGRKRADVIGKKLSQLIIPQRYRSAHAQGMQHFLETGIGPVLNRRIELAGLHADGREFPVEISIVATVLDGKPIFTAYLRDITERKRVEAEIRALTHELEQRVEDRTQELRAANAALERAMRMKDEFLATVSHELRTPLGGVIGMVELLAETPLTGQQRRFADVARTSADLLLSVINDILDFSRMEAGEFDLAPRDFNPAAVVQDLAAVFDVRAKDKRLELRCRLDPAVNATFHGDDSRLRQILMNLLANAMKFTECGEVVVSAAVTTVQHGIANLRFSVNDTGIGIAEDQLARLFQPFSQVDASLTRRYGGSGLGLAICRKLVERMGGQIGVASELGKGSTFWFTLPLKTAATAGRPPTACQVPHSLGEPAGTKRSLSVLIAEDNPANQMVLVALLEKLTHRCRVVENGRQAVAACQSEQFDLIMLDVQMPEMDGPQAARVLRAATGPNQKTPIVAVTAHVAPRDRESFLESGMDDILIKPVQRLELNRILAKLFGDQSSQPVSKLDVEAMLSRLEGNRSLLNDLIAVYHRDWPQWSQELSEAIESADWPQVAFKAHRLRGLVRTFSAGSADEAMASLEEAARRSHSEDVQARWHIGLPLLKALSSDLQDVRAELANPVNSQ